MIKAIIFDCFGVLIEDALAAMRDKLKESAPEKYDEAIEILHAAHRGLITPAESDKKIASLLNLNEQEYRRQLAENEVKNVALMDFVIELKQGYKTAILSNISTGGIARRFSEADLKLFDVVVASSDTGYAKPEAQIYEITADKLGVKLAECIFTDDNEDYCDAARGLGMQAIHYENFEQFKRELASLLA